MSRTVTKLFLATILLIATAFLPRSGQATTCCGYCVNKLFACQDACATNDNACAALCLTRFQGCGRSCGPGGCGS
jgi:hypothetical protein